MSSTVLRILQIRPSVLSMNIGNGDTSLTLNHQSVTAIPIARIRLVIPMEDIILAILMQHPCIRDRIGL